MSGKITTAEFQDWSQKINKITNGLLQSIKFETPQKEKEWIGLQGIYIFATRNGVFFAPLSGIINLSTAISEDGVNQPLIELDGLTFSQWAKQVFQRLKEHCIAEGYYNPTSPPDLTSLKERWNAAINKIIDTKYLSRLLIYANSEEYKNIVSYVSFLKEVEKIIPGTIEVIPKSELEPKTSFLIVDMVGRVEKLDNLLKQAEKSSPSTANSPPPANSNYTTNLGAEITDLQNQVKQLEDKIKDNSTATNPIEKETYQKLLEDIKKRLGDKEKEFQKIKKQETNDNKPNNNLPLIIGISAAAIVFLLIIIIILLARPSRRHD